MHERKPHPPRVALGLLMLVFAATACAPGAPRIDGEPGAPVAPATVWPEPPAVRPAPPAAAPPVSVAATAALSADSATAASPAMLSLADVVAIALRNNPTTQESWANAQAAANAYGASRGALYPTVNGEVDLARSTSSGGGGVSGATGTGTGGATDTAGTGRTGTGTTGGGGSGSRTTLTPSLSLSYLIFDMGGRAGSIEAAKQRAIEADLAHNAAVADVILQVESSVFSYIATRALRDAQITSVNEAKADLAAATERHRVGVATLEEELQTQTALSQATLQLESLEASLATAHGNLAVAMGLQANARFEVPAITASDSVLAVASTVDTLINRALMQRPEIAESDAAARELAAEVRVARSAGYPALTLRSNASYVHSSAAPASHSTSLQLGLSIPVFNGFATQANLRAARDDYLAGVARARSTRQQVSLQVLTAYYALQSATQSVRTTADLLAAAQQSADVALGRYRAGVGTIVDLLLARSSLAAARASSIQARWEWRTALVQLAHDAGSLDMGGRPALPLTADTTGSHR